MIPFILDLAAKSTLLLLLALSVTLVFRRVTPAVRHLIWSLALIGLLALPVLTCLLPAWRVLPVWTVATRVGTQMGRPNVASPTPVDFEPASLPGNDAGEVTPGRVVPEARPVVRFSWRDWLVTAYILGLVIALLPLAVSMMTLTRLRRRASALASTDWIALLNHLRDELHVRVPVALLQSSEAMMPMTWGLLRPCILLPRDAEQWSPDRRRLVLLHELAHIKRRDTRSQFVARMVCALYWPHPLVWLAARQQRAAAELACDDLVLNAQTKPSTYASEILDMASTLQSPKRTNAAAIAMARPSQLEHRLLAILDGSRSRRGLTRAAACAVLLVGVATLVVVAACQVKKPEESKMAQTPATMRTGMVIPSDEVNRKPDQYYVVLASVRSRPLAEEVAVFAAQNGVDDLSVESMENRAPEGTVYRSYRIISVEGFRRTDSPEGEALRQRLIEIGRKHPEAKNLHKGMFDDAYFARVMRSSSASEAAPSVAVIATNDKARFPSGLMVELLAVGTKNSDSAWWKSDGSVTSTKITARKMHEVPAGMQGRRLAFQFSEATPEDAGITIRYTRSGVHRLFWYSRWLKDDVKKPYVIDLSLEKPIDALTLQIGMGFGAWSELATYAPDEDTTRGHLPAGYGFERGAELEHETEVAFSSAYEDRQLRFIAIDRDGQQVAGQESHATIKDGPNGGYLTKRFYRFSLPPENVKVIRADYRMYEWVEFRDIAMNPAQRADAGGAVLTAADVGASEPAADAGSVRDVRPQDGAQRSPENQVDAAIAHPVVMKTFPVADATNVDPATNEIRVTFSKDMTDGSWSWVTLKANAFPKVSGKIHYLEDKRTCVLPVQLEPNHHYKLGINSNRFRNFQDPDGRSAEPFVLEFDTGPGDGRAPATAPAENELTKPAQTAAEQMLTQLDAGKYGAAWEQWADFAKKQMPQKTFVTALESARGPLGKVVERKLLSAQYMTQLPGAPDGQYVVLQYQTEFENKKSAVETITPMKEKDGSWRVSGYFIK